MGEDGSGSCAGLSAARLWWKIKPVKREKQAARGKASPRVLLKTVLTRLRQEPLKQLPERSVEAISQFLSGYSMFGGPVWQELRRFDQWLMQSPFWFPDLGKWDRYIRLHSEDAYDSYRKFFSLYAQFTREVPDSPQGPLDPRFETKADGFDFYQFLYCIGRRPGMYLGNERSAKSLSAYLSGYFAGKLDAGLRLSGDEKQFLRFESWMCRTYKYKRRYPWHILVELWPRNSNSCASFFDEFDAYLTDFGKKPRGLEDRFEVVTQKGCTTIRRRRKLPKEAIRSAQPTVWWRSTANR